MTVANNNPQGNKQEVDISVLVAVYNIEKFLPQCLESLRRQTLKSAEFIVVDDGSTDSSGEICEKFKQLDSRFTVIHQPNEGLVMVRKRGVELARGKWTIFVDGDDFLPADDVLACELELAEKTNVDILRFSVEIRVEDQDLDAEKEKKFFSNYRGNFKGFLSSTKEIIEQAYEQRSFIHFLWDKIFRTSVLKKTQQFVPKMHLVSAEDLYLFFLTCFFSSSFCSVETKPFYCYRYGNGISTGKVTMSKFRHNVQEANLVKYFANFLKSQGKFDSYESVLKIIEKRFIHAAADRFAKLGYEDSIEGFDLLINNNPIEYVVEKLYRVFHSKPAALADKLYGSPVFQPITGTIETVAIYFPRIRSRREKTVIADQTSLFLSLGYKVVLLVEDVEEDLRCVIQDSIAVVVLPQKYDSVRSCALSEAIHKYKIDTFLYHAVNDQFLLFDLIQIKVLRHNIIVISNELPTQAIMHSSTFFSVKPHIYRLADVLVVTNFMELNLYRSYGAPVHYISDITTPNSSGKVEKSKDGDTKYVLWIGHIDENQKNYREALEIFLQVVRVVPTAVCLMVGEGDTTDRDYIKNYISKNSLENRVKFIESAENLEKYYSLADVHLVTSNYESFCWEIIESKSYGIPLVLYEMPYLEILKDKKGYKSVARHDKKAASRAIVNLLNDDMARNKLGQEARQSILDFTDSVGNPSRNWKNLLSSLSQGKTDKDGEANTDEGKQNLNLLFWDTTASFIQEGINQKNKVIDQLKREKEKARQEAEKVKQEKEQIKQEKEKLKAAKLAVEKKLNASLSREKSLKQSMSFRVGRVFTWVPRKVRDCLGQSRRLK